MEIGVSKQERASCVGKNLSCKNGKYLAGIADDSVIMCNEIMDTTDTVSTNSKEKR